MSEPWDYVVRRVVSGGQTGVDRGALDAAIALGLDQGGWCPKGRLAEDGVIPERYQLRETSSPEYRQRTERNVLDSDGTLILYRRSLQGGTELTCRLARKHRRPYLLVDLAAPVDWDRLRNWLADPAINVLNVAGPRESSAPGIAAETDELLRAVLAVQRDSPHK